MKTKNREKVKNKKFRRIWVSLLLIASLVFFGSLFYLDIVPTSYLIIALIVIMLILLGLIFLIFSRKKFLRAIGIFISIIFMAIFVFGEVYLYNTLGFLSNINNGNIALKNYNVLTLKSSEYEDIKDLKNKKIGISKTSTDIDNIKDDINKNGKYKYLEYDDTESLVNMLLDKEIDGIVLESSEISLLKEESYDKYDKLRIIYNIEIKNNIESLKDAVNINKESFNIYVSGTDTYGKVNSSSRSDVNMVVTVNPKDEKILITWIPRDYYVKINNSSYKDKLTHAGIYGIDSSIYAIENLLDIDINYYVKVNFTGVMKIIDVLGGITIENDETFTGQDVDNNFKPYRFKKGTIKLNSKEALVYVRERHNVQGGDLGRGRHQVIVLKALMQKLMSKEVISSYNSILSSLSGSFVTNVGTNTMTSFVKKEISSPRDWQFDSINLVGTDASSYTYTYKNVKLYVMEPKEESVNEAKEKIKEVQGK